MNLRRLIELANKPVTLPVPPRLQRIADAGPREDRFTSRLRGPGLAARLGLIVAVLFTVSFLTGLASHVAQHPPGWLAWPSRPVGLYRFTQGLHFLSGVALLPAVLLKLWSVYPLLFQRPAVRSLAHGVERVLVGLLVGAVLFQIVTGLLNVAHLYPWEFFFPAMHYAVAWLAAGAVLVHIAVQLPVIRQGLVDRRPHADSEPQSDVGTDGERDVDVGGSGEPGADAEAPTRRTVLLAGGIAVLGGLAVTAGATVRPLRDLALLTVADGQGPQGVPVNKTAAQARVIEAATDPAFRLEVAGERSVFLSLDDLAAMPQRTETLPIACVEGWSAVAEWEGVRISDLLALVDAPPDVQVEVISIQEGSLYSRSTLGRPHVRDPLSLLALRLNGEPLDLDHGFPCRLIAPSLPGVSQTKWVQRLQVLS